MTIKDAYKTCMSGKAIAVYQYLSLRADKERKRWPKHKTIASELSVSVSSVKRALDELTERGFIRRERRKRADGGFSSNCYILL